MKGRSAGGLRTLRRVRAREGSHRGRDALGLRINLPSKHPLRDEVAASALESPGHGQGELQP